MSESTQYLDIIYKSSRADLVDAERLSPAAALLIEGFEDDLELIYEDHENNLSNVESDAQLESRDHAFARGIIKVAAKMTASLQLEAVGNTDSLTRLNNREFLSRYVEEVDGINNELQRNGEEAVVKTAAFIDLNKFKEVNDTFSHTEGDNILALIGSTLADQFGSENIVCRWGGDEFVIIFDGAFSEEKIEALKKQIVSSIEAAELDVPTDEITILVNVSAEVGMVQTTEEITLEEAIRQCDDMMLEAKKKRGRRAGDKNQG